MRKIILILLFILLFFSLSFNLSFAQENLSIKEATMSSASQEVNKSADYQLPYPGILPDNPLYFLKAIRDRIVGLLISDPLKKAEFDLLQADKRLNTGIYLFKMGKSKQALALSTISKGENYFEEAIAKVREGKRQNLETNDILRRLSDSSYKHQEVLKSLGFASLQKRAADFAKQVDSLRSQK